MSRPDWDDYFLQIADLVSSRGTCDRLQVGAVLVRDRMIISTGYNGAPKGCDSCDEKGHKMVDGHCVRSVHAEVNAVVQAAWQGTPTKGSTLYTKYFPCEKCVTVLINAGVIEIVYKQEYVNLDKVFSLQMLKQAGVRIKQLS